MVIIDSKGKPKENSKSTADKYAAHCELDWSKTAGNKIIDVNKRGKAKDVTNGKTFVVEEPEFTQ
jgi:hypothetical protein